tara:strand:+ start:180 stop:2660 length:2481 start_codon:yes stop_codon:yes gene_type:complete
MALQISDTTPKNQYTATSGQTTFAVSFEFFDVADLKVFNGTTLLTYSNSPSSASQYSVIGAGVTGGGSITLGGSGAALNDVITIIRDVAIARTSDFPVSGNFPIQTLNTELDKIVAMMQQLEEKFLRTLQYPVTSTTTFNADLPGELIANKVLAINSSGDGFDATQELGVFRGNWAASTSYNKRDLVKDTSTNNIFIVLQSHTSSGAQPLTTNANSAKYELVVDAATATTSATNAASSASAASTSESNAAASATTATTKATEAATSATNAATSETNAATSATTATTKAAEAVTSANNAATSETNAASSATTASTQATNATNSATAAATSETNAGNSATAAANSATAAATSETNASNSATTASTQATNASNSATAAASSQSAAASAQTAAESARDSALASFDSFDDRYLGPKSSDPSVDNDGNALVAGALYFNSSAGAMKVYTGSAWVDAYSSGTTFLQKSNNLSDLPNAGTARTNMGVAIGSDVQAHSSVLDATTASYTTALNTKLSGIETGATADQSDAEIKTAYENNSNTNAFTDTLLSKLNAIEASATADQTDSEIKTAYENNADTNAFTDALLTKLNGIETSATADQSDAEIKTAYENNSNTNAFTDAEKTKLSGIETNATADQTQSEITALVESAALDMGSNDITTTGKIKFANMYAQLSDLPSATTYHGMFAHVHATGKAYYAHGGAWIELGNKSEITSVQNSIPTSTSALAEGSNLYFTDERVDDRVNGLLQAGTNINLAYDDAANTLTISSTGSSSTSSPEIYGFNYTVGTGILQVTTTNGGNDNISSATYATFDDVVYASTGFTWSITTTGELRATI